jgi:hypothetical protein
MVIPGMRRDGLVMAAALIALLALATPVTALTVAINPSGDISGTLDSRNITIAFIHAGSGGSVILNPGTYYMGGHCTWYRDWHHDRRKHNLRG